MSPVISWVLLPSAGSNSLYLHSFIAFTPHSLPSFIITAAMTTLEAPDLRVNINQASHRSVSSQHTNIISSDHIPTSHMAHHFTEPGHTCPDILELTNMIQHLHIVRRMFHVEIKTRYRWVTQLCFVIIGRINLPRTRLFLDVNIQNYAGHCKLIPR